MPIFRRKIPPLWYVLYPSPSAHSPNSQPTREGPYTRSSIAQLLADGRLSNGALIWTNERIFPNAEKPLSSRLVRIPEWRRWDQLPDPVVRELQAEARSLTAASAPPATVQPDEEQPAPAPLTNDQIAHVNHQQTHHHNQPPPPSAGGQHAAPGAYPVGTYTASAQQHPYPPGTTDNHPAPAPPTSPGSSAHTPGIYPQPSAYPQSSIYPASTGRTSHT